MATKKEETRNAKVTYLALSHSIVYSFMIEHGFATTVQQGLSIHTVFARPNSRIITSSYDI